MFKGKQRENIRIVLVQTGHPGNIGGAARAMKNMCIDRLYLVAPREFPAFRAVWRAAGAKDVLENATVVPSVDEAIEGCGLVIGASARDRRIPWPCLSPRECGQRIWEEAQSHSTALLFGSEDRGLSNEHLQKCHYHVWIPANPNYSSLNLSAAVQVLSYEINTASIEQKQYVPNTNDESDVPAATVENIERFYQHLEDTMTDIGFYDPQNPKQLMTRMRRLFARIRMDEMEVSILRGLLSAVQRNYSASHPGNKTDDRDS